MEYKDYYKILGVDRKATQDEIKKAFRNIAVKNHPDKNPDNKKAEEVFKLANEANSVLSNPEKRKKYDELGENWQQYEQSGNQSAGNPFGGAGSADGAQQYYGSNEGFGGQADFSDFFDRFFAGNARDAANTQSRRGGDYETEMEISLEEAYQGADRTIQVENEKFRIAVKPGSYDGQVLRIKNKGARGSNRENRGDLFVRVKVKPHAHFIRKGDDLYDTISIDVYTAVLGGEIVVNTLLSGQVKIKIGQGTQNGKTIRLKGKGMPVYEKPNDFGNLTLLFQVQIPDKLTDMQRDLFEQLKATV
ncbi:DnaJ C-terminal domain-containing protein [Runella sp.]|uniref:DnaJ C-terminal domain-containing protein n=1 Tax=Runella sp. TaxID=1960881 RepID=UPI003D0B384B